MYFDSEDFFKGKSAIESRSFFGGRSLDRQIERFYASIYKNSGKTFIWWKYLQITTLDKMDG